jgi:hypothetical protein
MNVLVYSLILLATAFVAHLLVWRVRLPRRQTRALASLFALVLAVGLAAAQIAAAAVPEWAPHLPLSAAQSVHIALFFTAFTLAYLITYSALETDSPSLIMVMTLDRAGSEGMAIGQFLRFLNDKLLVFPRIDDLLRDDMVQIDGQRYRLTAKGRRFVRVFLLHRGLLGAPKGG